MKTFLELADTKSFIQTAKKLNMTQPGVSQHLKMLEAYYEVELVKRKGKLFELTEPGRKLRHFCEVFFRESEVFRGQIRTDVPSEGICQIASTGSIGLMVHDLILLLHKKYPKLVFNFTVAPNESVLRGVENEQFPMGFVAMETNSWGIKNHKLAQERLLLVAPKKAKISSLKDLYRIGFVGHPDGYGYGNHILSENFPDTFKRIEDIPMSGSINQNNRILYAVESGLGFSVVPEYTYRHHPNKKNIQIVSLKKQIMSPVNLIVKKDKTLPKRYSVFMTELRKYLGELPDLNLDDQTTLG